MTLDETSTWRRILDDARRYPSPHNSQPIKIKLIDDMSAELFYDKLNGLPAESYGVPFGFVCVGTFLECLRVAAAASGYSLNQKLKLTDMDFTDPNPLHSMGVVGLVKNPNINLQKAAVDLQIYRSRRTSRRPYDNQLVDTKIINQAQAIAANFSYDLQITTNQQLVKDIIAINQKTLFDDLRHEPVYRELMQWLRFSSRDARAKADGLSAEALLIPGFLLKFAFKNRWLWEVPVIGGVFKWLYIRTMKGVRQLGWLVGAFETPQDYVRAGECFMQVWLYFTAKKVYLHPYGTVITNQNSHKQFTKLAQINEQQGMAWMLFRFGYSALPPKSERRSTRSMIIEDLT